MIVSIALVGCERGCLSKKVSGTQDSGLAFDLVDCPDGLARCVDGQLQKSKLGAVPPNATCPWISAGECPADCVEGIVVEEAHAAQLCRVEAGAWQIRRAPAEDCGEARFKCSANRVIDCEQKSMVAVCTKGCALDVLDDDVSEGDAVTILCLR